MNDSELLSHLMEQLPDAIFFKDDRCRFVRINRALASWYGIRDPAEAVGKSDADFLPQGFARVWERPQDLSIMVDRLLDDPIFGPRIDLRRVGAAGFSIGGYTALALAGGMLDLHALQAAYRESPRGVGQLPASTGARLVRTRREAAARRGALTGRRHWRWSRRTGRWAS